MFKEFKAFAMRGNVIDMAVGIVIGGAFGKVVSSFVGGIVMPLVGMLTGGVDFADMEVVLKEGAADGAGKVAVTYGAFINTVVDFLIIAFAIFMVVKAINSTKKKEEEAAPTTKDCPRCLSSIPLDATRCAHCTSDV